MFKPNARLLLIAVFAGMICFGAIIPPAFAEDGEEKKDDDIVTITVAQGEQSQGIIDIIKLYGKETRHRFLYDDAVAKSTTKIKLYFPESDIKIRRDRIIPFLRTVLRLGNIIMSEEMLDAEGNKLYRLSLSTMIQQTGFTGPIIADPSLLPEEDEIVTCIYTLKYSEAPTVGPILGKFASPHFKNIVNQQPVGDILFITDYSSRVKQMIDIIKLYDIPPAGGIRPEIITLINADVSMIQPVIDAYLQLRESMSRYDSTPSRRSGRAPAQPQYRTTADTRTNSLILFADDYTIQEVTKLIQKLDRSQDIMPNLHHIKLKFTDAEDLAKSLTELYRGIEQRPGRGQPTPATSGTPDIVADKQTNSLLVAADRDKFEEISYLVSLLDKRRPQVYIEAAIVEVSADDNFLFGVESGSADDTKPGHTRGLFKTFANLSSIEFDTENNQINISPIIPPGGLLFGITKNRVTNIPFIVNALKRETNVHVLSTPRSMAMDNEESSILIKDQVATIQVTHPSTAGDVATTSFDEYVDAKVELRFTPHITENAEVRLEIAELTIEAFTGAQESNEAPPPKRSRTLKTMVSVPNMRTLIVGGLITDDQTQASSGIPWFSKIPYLGKLFGSENKRNLKRMLFIFITPHIIDSEGEYVQAERLTEIEITKLRELGFTADEIESINNYYGTSDLLNFKPERLQLIDYRSPEEIKGE